MVNFLYAGWINARDSVISRTRRIAKRRECKVHHLSAGLKAASHVVVVNVYNEGPRLPYFLDYYRAMGFQEFVVVDNMSNDGTLEMLANQADVSIIRADGQYKNARFGCDWVNGIVTDYCASKWVLYVDADEFLVYPECDTKNIVAFTEELRARGCRSLQCVMVDMYSDRSIEENLYRVGQDPLEVCSFFDKDGYQRRYDAIRKTIWIKGGVRGSLFFPGNIWDGPALNKTPLVYWKKGDAFLRSTHQLSPPALNEARGTDGVLVNGALLHFKFTSVFTQKVDEEAERKQHAAEYAVYHGSLTRVAQTPFFSERSTRYESWRSLRAHRLI